MISKLSFFLHKPFDLTKSSSMQVTNILPDKIALGLFLGSICKSKCKRNSTYY